MTASWAGGHIGRDKLEAPITFSDSMTLGEARKALRKLVDEGHKCPCCTQFAKVYKRKLNASMARTLITMFRHGAADDFVHTPSLPGDTHEASQLSWWGLTVEEKALREDGGRTGWWKLTPKGRDFVENITSIEKYALIYDGRLLRLVDGPIGIRACLGSKFNYYELMRA